MDIETLIARGLQVLLALGGAYLIALWFVLVIWTFRDIETRSRSVVTQVFSTLLVVLFYLPGLVLYRLLRPKETLDEAYQRSLEEEYLLQDLEELPLCPSCNHYVNDDFQICPHCATHLREPCRSCERLIDLRWDVCPYCGTMHQGQPKLEPTTARISDERWVDPAAIERRLRAEEARRTRDETRALPAATSATALGQAGLDALTRQHPVFNGEVDGAPPAPEPVERQNGSGEAIPETARDEPATPPKPTPDLTGLEDPDHRDEPDEETTKQTIPDRYRV